MSLVTAVPGFDLTLCIPELKSRKREAALLELAHCAHSAGGVTDPRLLAEILSLREQFGSTDLGKGFAVPQARSVSVVQPRLVLGRSTRGLEWNRGNSSVHLVLLVAAPADWSESAFHDLVTRAVGVGRLQKTRQRLLDAGSDMLPEVVRGMLA